jgi:hypothetical protein
LSTLELSPQIPAANFVENDALVLWIMPPHDGKKMTELCVLGVATSAKTVGPVRNRRPIFQVML